MIIAIENPLIKDGNPITDDDEAREILVGLGLNASQVVLVLEWFNAYGDFKDELWSYDD